MCHVGKEALSEENDVLDVYCRGISTEQAYLFLKEATFICLGIRTIQNTLNAYLKQRPS